MMREPVILVSHIEIDLGVNSRDGLLKNVHTVNDRAPWSRGQDQRVSQHDAVDGARVEGYKLVDDSLAA